MASILVIDDDQAVRSFIRRALKGHDVVEAENGDAGLAALDRQRFDLVITDVLMPGREGVEVIRAMRLRPDAAKILVISGGGPEKRLDYLQIAEIFGADRSLAKPFRAAELRRAVADLIGDL